MKKQLITLATLAGGFVLGASALVALADWTQAPPNPPQNNAPAPINVGAGTPVLNLTGIQEKTNSLIIDGGLSVLGNLNINKGSVTAPNSVLTNDGSGNAAWATSAAAVGIKCGSLALSRSGGGPGGGGGVTTLETTNSDGTWIFYDAGSANDIAVTCKAGVLTGICGIPGGAANTGLPRGFNDGVFYCQ
jgi:hypothetical protein